ncbi:unnamed protein product, partial [Rotaria sp. Silwood2]
MNLSPLSTINGGIEFDSSLNLRK